MSEKKCSNMCSEMPAIRYGTPVIDGKLDDLYLDSYCYEEKPLINMNYF